jgi:proline iminopeptidase
LKRLAHTLCILFISAAANAQDSSFHFTTSDGVQLYVMVAGKGAPCLFLHGGPGNTSHYFEDLPAAKLLEQKMRLVYFDQRGGGRSASAKDSNYSIQRMETDIEELRNYLKIKEWAVMGHSFGGVIMTAYARDYQEKIRALVYVECGLNLKLVLKSHIDNGTRMLREIGDTFTVNKQLTPFHQMMSIHEELAKKGIEYKIMFRSQREKDIEDSLIGAATPHFNQDFSHRVWTMPDYLIDYSIYTKDISCPVLIIAGTRDYAVGPDSYKAWQFKHMQLVLYNGAHVSFQEEPVWFVNTVLPFLEKNSLR